MENFVEKKSRLSFGMFMIVFMILVITIPDIVIGVTVFQNVRSNVQKQLDGSTANSLNVLNQNLTQFIQEKMQYINQLSQNLSGDSKRAGRVQSTLGTVQGIDKDETALYLASTSGSLTYLPSNVKIPKSLDPRTRPWYKLARQHPGKPVITPPYLSADGSNAMTVTIAETTSDGSGVIGMDLNLNRISSMVKMVKIGENGYAFLLDGSNTWVANPKVKAGQKASNELIKSIGKGKAGSFDQNGQNIHFVSNKLTGWKIGGVMSLQEIGAIVLPIMTTIGLIALIMIVIIILLVILIVRKYILKPVNNMVTVFGKISEKDLTEQFDNRTTMNKEFTSLGNSVNKMVASLKQVIQTLGEKSELLAASSEELTASTEENKATSDEIAGSVQHMAEAADQQSESVQELTKDAEAVNKVIQAVTEQTNNLSRKSNESKSVVDKGQKTVDITSHQMNKIKQTVGDLSEMVNNLSKRTKEIVEIIDAINEISAQTQLLSLNASIEAARAGEQGRGFAVVAGEIQKLSAQSATSANRINEIISVIQKDTEEVVQSMNKGIQEVDKGIDAVNQSDASFSQIEKFVNSASEETQQVTAVVNSIAKSIARSAASYQPIEQLASETSANAQNISAATEQQSASIEEIAKNASSLSQIADELNQVVASFKR